MREMLWRKVLAFGAFSVVQAFKIEFGYGTSTGEFELLQTPAVYSPTDDICHEITNALAPGEEADFIRVQSLSPNDGDPAGIIAFYSSDEACRESNPMYIAWFKSVQNSIQAIVPYWTIVHLGSLRGSWTLGRTGYPEPKAWKNIPRRGISPEIGIVRGVKLRPGDTTMLFDEGWGVDAGGVVWEPNNSNTGPTGSQDSQNPNIVPGRTPSFQTKQTDGTEIFIYPDGSGKAIIPDGPVVDMRADGTSVAHQDGPDGFIAEFNPQTGALIQDSRGRNLHLNLEELEGIEALEAAGLFESPTIFNEVMSGLQSSLFSPSAEGYDGLSRLNGDFVADLGGRVEDDSPAEQLSRPKRKGKNIFQSIGSGVKNAYNWARRSCKFRSRKSARSPVVPECAADIDFMRENDFSPFSIGSPAASVSDIGEQSANNLRGSLSQQGQTVETANGDEQSFKYSFSPVPAGTEGEYTDENLDSPYFARRPGNEFTFRETEGSKGSEDVGQEVDEIIQSPSPADGQPLGILDIFNRKKGISEFTFKGDQGIQTINDIYEEDPLGSYPDMDGIEEDVVVQDISRASSSY
ncbi:hypothetical protein TWF718_007887 [Orbilia javanica]|uniref:Uncharacterized protein n=1 Tax=Orbilia javanica TaxID=47235 RepID=A0AAN8MRV6_9PEZI